MGRHDERETVSGDPPKERALGRVGEGFVVGGRYRLEEPLGRGGMGTVWRAEHVPLRRPVALKLLHTRDPSSTAAIRRFEREAQIAASIDHPSCVRVLDFGVDGWAGHYLVMQLLEGPTLEDELAVRGPVGLTEVIASMRPIASALDTIHSLGLVHRDVKPSNVVVGTRNGARTLTLVDFGLAAHVDGRARITQRGALIGTPHYMAPELLEGASASPKSDTYSLGVVAYELLTGELPFDDGPLPQLLGAKLDGRPRSLGETTGRIFNLRVEEAFTCALARDPSDRPASAGELVERLLHATIRR